MSSHPAPRRIKRYGNRKLYDLDAKRYVTLEELAAMVASGLDIEVIDQRTGEDLTSLTLVQVLLEGLKEKTARIPRQVLVRLVRLLSLDEALTLRQDVAQSVHSIVSETQAGIEGRIRGLFEALTPTPEPPAKKHRVRTAGKNKNTSKNKKRTRRTA